MLYEDGLIPALRWLGGEMQERHGLAVTVDAGDDEPPLSDDIRAMLFEATRELLFNVVKHANVAEALVEVGHDHDLFIAVSDKGKGFDPDSLAGKPHEEGQGLFSIRERLAALGGSMAIESTSGDGTSIQLVVPLQEEASPCTAPSTQEDSPSERIGRDREGRPRVLIVDDHALIREGIANMISSDERLAIVGEAADGLEALEAVEQLQPDVVVMDVNMPRMNGVEATRAIVRRWGEVRVVALSVQDDEATANTMLNAGAVAFVAKSADMEQVIAAILAAVPS